MPRRKTLQDIIRSTPLRSLGQLGGALAIGIQPEVLAEGIDLVLAKLKETQEPLTEDVLFSPPV